MATKPRAFTEREVQRQFIDRVVGIADYWAGLPDKNSKEKCNGTAFSILALLDGANVSFPSIDLHLAPHPDDEEYNRSNGENWYEMGMCFNGGIELHELFGKKRSK